MVEIRDLLSKFNDLLLSEEIKIEAVRNVIAEAIGAQIKKEDIKIKNNIIYLNIRPIYKNEILLKRGQIFLKLKEVFGKKAPRAIR